MSYQKSIAPHNVQTGSKSKQDFSKSGYDQLVKYVANTIGLQLREEHASMVELRLRRRMHENQITSLQDYCELLFSGDDLTGERQHLINALTTNKTDFFREDVHYELLEQQLVPSLLAARTEANPILKVWSGACSNGAEIYSAAMILENMRRCGSGRFDFRCLASDVDTTVLNEAKRGTFRKTFATDVPVHLKEQFVLDGLDHQAGNVRISKDIRDKVSFAHLNLMDQQYQVDHDIDVIFLRNVLIYFSPEDQQKVVRNISQHLRKGGFLLLGHSESGFNKIAEIRQIAPAVYERV